jgi:SlyX protein
MSDKSNQLVEQRITELEIKMAHQELTIEELNQIIIKQQTEIDNFHTYLKILKNEMESLQFDQKESMEQSIEQPPPHY